MVRLTMMLFCRASLLVMFVGSPWREPPQLDTAKHVIDLSVVDAAGRQTPLPGAFTFDSSTAPASETDTIDSLLRARGIRPDPDAYGLVYELNPTLMDLEHGAAGRSVLLPLLPKHPAISAALAQGALIAIGVNRDLRGEFTQRAKAIDDDLVTIVTPPSERCSKASAMITTEADVRKAPLVAASDAGCVIVRLSRELRRGTGPALPRPVMQDLVDDAGILAEVLDDRRKHSDRWRASPEEISAITSASLDIQVKEPRLAQVAGGGAPPPFPRVRVVVRVLGRDAQPVATPVRITYVHKGSASRPNSYRQFSAAKSPYAECLYEAFYTFWATDGVSPQRLTAALDVIVEQSAGTVKTVDLLLK